MPGGKQKQSQRTKGNVKPSSSGRAAELLAASGGGKLGFVGFETMSDMGYVPLTPGDEVDACVDADFRMLLRKFGKKDTVTKLKTLQEFQSLCKEKDNDVLNGVLPYWPRLYSKLCMDNDRRVREATQLAFESLVVPIRRSLAPHLKVIMPPWFLVQSDPHTPASAAATRCFLTVFPQNKHTDVILHCKDEIFTHLKDNLFTQTVHTLSDNKTPKEDAESRYTRVMTSSLLALRQLVILETENDFTTQLEEILAQQKFWRLSKHVVSQIRASFYSLVSALCSNYTELCRQHADKVCPSILHRLDDLDTLVTQHLWEAVVAVIGKVETCWRHVNMKKAVLPQLWTVLKVGGQGSAKVIYPVLLPLISKLPPEVATKEFYQDLFTRFGCDEARSTRDVRAVVTAYMECLRYVINQYVNADDVSSAQNVIETQLLPLVQRSLLEEVNHLSTTSLYHQLSDLLDYFNTHSQYKQLEIHYWSHFTVISQQCLVTSHEQCLVTSHEQCLVTSHTPLNRLGDLLVTFKRREKKHDSVNELCIDLVSSLCRTAFTSAKEMTSLPHIYFLSRVLGAYQSPRLVSDILVDGGEEDVCLYFCRETLLPWISQLNQADLGYHGLRGLIQLLVAVHQMTSQESSKDAILDDVTERFHSARVVYELIRAFMSHRDDVTIHRWYRSQSLGGRLINISQQILSDRSLRETDTPECRETDLVEKTDGPECWKTDLVEKTDTPECGKTDLVEKTDRPDSSDVESVTTTESEESGEEEAAWKLLRLTLTFDENFEPLIDPECVNEILQSLTSALLNSTRTSSHTNQGTPSNQSAPSNLGTSRPAPKTVQLICDLTQHFFSNLQLVPQAQDLLFVLFKLSFMQNVFSESSANQIRSTWLVGVKALANQRGGCIQDGGFLQKAANHIRTMLCLSLSNERIDHVVMETNNLLECLHQCSVSSDGTCPLTTPVVMEMMKTIRLAANFSSSTWVSTVLIEGTIPVSLDFLNFNMPFDSTHAPTLTSQISMVIGYGRLMTSLAGDVTTLVRSELLDIDYLLDMTITVAHLRTSLGTRMEQCATSESGVAYVRLLEDYTKIVDCLDDERKRHLAEILVIRSLTEGGVVALSLPFILDVVHYDVITILENISWCESVLPEVQTLSVCIPHLSQYGVIEMALRFLDDVNNLEPRDDHYVKLSRSLMIVRRCMESVYKPCTQDNAHLDDVIVSLLNTLIQWTLEDHSVPCITSSVTWYECLVHHEVVRIWTCVVRSPLRLTLLNQQHWDYLLCNLVNWVKRIDLQQVSTNMAHSLTSSHVLTLLYHTAAAMLKVVPELESVPSSLVQEWKEFFSLACYTDALEKYIRFTELCNLDDLTQIEDHVIRTVSQSLIYSPSHCRLSLSNLVPRLTPDSYLDEKMETLLNYLCPLLSSVHRSIQLTAYHLLDGLVAELSSFDEDHDVLGQEKSDEIARSPPTCLVSLLRETGSLVEVLVDSLSPCQAIRIEPYTTAYTFTLSYLLTWKLLLKFFKAASSELRAEYATYLKQHELIDNLMLYMTHLLPENPVIQLNEVLTRHSPDGAMTSSRNMFSQPPMLTVAGDARKREIEHLSCQVFYTALEDLPAVIRQWLNNQTKTTASYVDRYTSKYVSPLLCHQEISAVHESSITFNNMVVKTRPAAREVCAIYTVDDVSMEIVVVLPSNYPFGVVTVETGKRVGVATAQWRNWMLQMTTILNHQNGSILDGLTLWKKNIDKKFEGVEDCMICFSVIHGSNCQLPKQQCRTCKKKYHSACLYKWFNTSNNTACPLCRNLF